MSELLKSGKVGNIQVRQLAEQRSTVLNRWEQTGLLEGLSSSSKGTIAQLMENEAGHLLSEASNQLDNIAGFDIAAFPMVRRVFSRLLANDIVSVQPLNLPSGLLFYMDHQVGTDADNSNSNFSSVYDAHYDNSGFDYSKGTVTPVSGVGVAGITAGTGGTITMSGNATAASALTVQSLPSLKVTVISGGSAAAGDEVDYALGKQEWTGDMIADNVLSVTLPGLTKGGDTYTAVQLTYDIFSTLEEESAMTEVKLVVTSTTVSVTTRKMKAHCTPELAQDLAAYHSVDAEAELTGLLSEELAAEIDREILRDLIHVAAFSDTWVYDMTATGRRLDGSAIAAPGYSGFQTQKVHNQTLITKINKVSAAIHKATLRGGANWIVCSTEIGSVLEDLEQFHAVNSPDQDQFNMGIEQIGSLGSRFTVYKDPWFPSDTLLMGHKGTSFMDTGYVYAPYIPFQLTPVVLDPNDFTPRKGIMTRYAKKVVNNRYYGKVQVVFPTDYDVVGVSDPYVP